MRKLINPVSSKTKLVFFGNERLATGVDTEVPVLRSLIEAEYDIQVVIVSHSQGVSRQRRGLEIVEVAHAYHIPVLIPEQLSDIIGRLEAYNAEAGVLAAFGKIIPPEIIDIFPKGIVNIHPSLLPELRGPTPVETAILEGLPKTGVSLMSLAAKMDAGPVYKKIEHQLRGDETKPQLARKLSSIGAKLLAENLEFILDGSIEAIPQDESAATYTKLLTKADGLADFGEPAELIERQVRAFLDFPRTRASLYGQDVIITKSRLAKDEQDGHLVVKCQPGWLEIQELVGPSGRTMSGADFLRGYRK